VKRDLPVLNSGRAESGRRGGWPYAGLFATQTVGAIILFWYGIPHYQEILADPATHVARTETLLWSLSSIGLIQIGFWVSHRIRPRLPKYTNALLGYIILFFARMSFVLATSVFGFVFITQKPGLQIPAFRYVLTLLGLFALFCYVQELERLGRLLLGNSNTANANSPR
jgi:hypothetical protein